MTRTLSHLAELQPELFAEISPELACEVGARNGDIIIVATPRGEIRARALVTPRIRPVTVSGRTLHQVGLPYHFGGRGLVKGDVVNDLVAISQEPNVRIMEAKALVCRVQAERLRPRCVVSKGSACGPSERPEGSAAERHPRARARGGGVPTRTEE
jgi:formate dehydrogenase major subunit